MAGYSDRALPQKLGIKPGATVITIDEPANYRKLLGKIPDGAHFSNRVTRGAEFIHFFATRRRDLKKKLSILRERLAQGGVIWIFLAEKISGCSKRCDRRRDSSRGVATWISGHKSMRRR